MRELFLCFPEVYQYSRPLSICPLDETRRIAYDEFNPLCSCPDPKELLSRNAGRIQDPINNRKDEQPMKYECPCGYVYDPEVGDPDSGIAPGTAWEDIPEDWVCPVCGLGKDAFTPV